LTATIRRYRDGDRAAVYEVHHPGTTGHGNLVTRPS